MIDRLSRRIKATLLRELVINKHQHMRTFLGSFMGIGMISILQHTLDSQQDTIFLIGSFGATAVLVFGTPDSPLAQPRHVLGGHIISACIGVATALALGAYPLWAASFAVALSIVAMQISRTTHPPGGATALIAVIGSEQIKNLGWWYILFPVASGAAILLLAAYSTQNMSYRRASVLLRYSLRVTTIKNRVRK